MADRRGGLRRRDVLTVGIAAGCLAYVLLSWYFRRQAMLPPVTWTAAVVLFALGCGLVAGGRVVRATIRGTARRPVDPLVAYRILRLAQACALAGAVTAGGYLAYVVVAWPDVDAGSVRADAVTAAVMAICGGLLCAAGLWVQSMCRIDRHTGADEDEEDASAPPRQDS